jgi:DNA replication initiation complex subunit (GINS family)
MTTEKITKEQEKILKSIRESKGIKKKIKGIEEAFVRKLTKEEKEIYFLGFLEGGAYISEKISKQLGDYKK